MFIVNSYWFVPSTSYLLDTYSAAAAYSLRQLKTGVTNVVRVRRSSDNAESDFTATEITDGTLTTWTGANDGFVVTWYDQSGNANNVTQSTGTNQPQIVSSGSLITSGTKNTIDFLSSSRYLRKGSNVGAFNAEPFSVFYVAENNASDVGNSVISTSPSSGDSHVTLRLDTDGTSNVMWGVRNTTATSYVVGASTNLSANTQYLISAFADSSKNISEFDNGSTGGTATFTGSINNNNFNIGAGWDLATEFTGKISEVIVFGSDESANRTDIESDINTHYSIY